MGAKQSKEPKQFHVHHYIHHCDACSEDSRSPSDHSLSNNRPISSPRPSSNTHTGGSYHRIDDDYESLEQVSQALSEAGLESSNLIIGIDFTISNKWTGAKSFNGKNLHHLGNGSNPYEQAISIIGRTLAGFDEDSLIPCYGFGDATSQDQDVFSFYLGGGPCRGFPDVLKRYREIVPQVKLAGPTSFAPIIETAIGTVNDSGGQYHILLIIADGQVTRSVDTPDGQLSFQEKQTIDAIVKASEYPLSIVLVGVGDGPWDQMYECDDHIPHRAFDNFQFVNFTDIMLKDISATRKETEFALRTLMEIPSQYKATQSLQLLGNQRQTVMNQCPLPPPSEANSNASSPLHISRIRSSSFSSGIRGNKSQNSSSFAASHSFQLSSRGNVVNSGAYSSSEHSSQTSEFDFSSSSELSSSRNHSPHNWTCQLCSFRKKNLVFSCGHQTCYECGNGLISCPSCQSQITTKIRLHD